MIHRTERSFETGEIRESGWTPIRRELGIRAFGVNAWTAGKGERLIPAHDEVPSGHQELYVVLAGRATFAVAEERIDAPEGTLVFVREPSARREAWAAEDGTTVLAVGGRPGEAYRPRSWELNADLLPLFDEGRFDEARAVILEALDRYEDRGAVLYNLACAEAQLGELEAAEAHLAEAVAERPEYADAAREDPDLAPLRAG